MTMREHADKLSDETMAAAKSAVANNQPLKDFLNETGAGDHPDIIRRFAENPHTDPKENLGPHFGERFAQKQRNPLGPKRKADMSPGQSLGSFLLGK